MTYNTSLLNTVYSVKGGKLGGLQLYFKGDCLWESISGRIVILFLCVKKGNNKLLLMWSGLDVQCDVDFSEYYKLLSCVSMKFSLFCQSSFFMPCWPLMWYNLIQTTLVYEYMVNITFDHSLRLYKGVPFVHNWQSLHSWLIPDLYQLHRLAIFSTGNPYYWRLNHPLQNASLVWISNGLLHSPGNIREGGKRYLMLNRSLNYTTIII